MKSVLEDLHITPLTFVSSVNWFSERHVLFKGMFCLRAWLKTCLCFVNVAADLDTVQHVRFAQNLIEQL